MLELAQQERGRTVTTNEIAQAQHIPPRFLETILRELKKNRYTESVRGKDGGYYLVKEPKQIRIGDIIKLFEGPLFEMNNKHAHKNDHVFTEIWKEAEVALSSVYDSITFEDLVRKSHQHVVDYSI